MVRTWKSCGLITLGNEIQPILSTWKIRHSCGLITLGNEIQHESEDCKHTTVVD